MATTNSPKTVSARRSVCTSGVETLASTIAAPVGRSVMDSIKLILIMPLPLLSKRDRRQLPCQGRSLSCNLDQTFCRLPGFGGKGQTVQLGFRIVSRDSQAGREA